VLPSIKVDADSRNIEELHVERDEVKFRSRKTAEQLQELAKTGFNFKDYAGMMAEMEKRSLVVDDISHHESEKLIKMLKPDVFCAGIKEKFVVEKMGVPCKQLHSYDYGGPYAGFRGAVNFYRDIARMVTARVWKHVTPPWQKGPEIEVRYARQ